MNWKKIFRLFPVTAIQLALCEHIFHFHELKMLAYFIDLIGGG
jgi:hypothetical protein